MKNKITNKSGITLIALVITIIVLLILAGVSISMISSQDGILGKATGAKESQRNATELERVNLAVQSALVDGEGTIDLTKATDSTKAVGLEKALKEEFKNDSKKPTYEEGKVTLTNGDVYNVTTSGSVEKVITFKKQVENLTIGDEVIASNGEAFYVIGFSTDKTKVNLLAKYNLKVDGSCQDTEGNNNECVFCSATAWDSADEGDGNDLNNKETIKSETTSAVSKAIAYGNKLGVTGRLMREEEIVALGGILAGTSSGCPAFINSQNFWLGSASAWDFRVCCVHGSSCFIQPVSYWEEYDSGVRPVLEVLTSSIK